MGLPLSDTSIEITEELVERIYNWYRLEERLNKIRGGKDPPPKQVQTERNQVEQT